MWISLLHNYQDIHKYCATLDISLAKNTLAQLSWKNLSCTAFDISLAKQNILAQLSCKNLSCTAFDISQAKQQNLAQPSCKKTFHLAKKSIIKMICCCRITKHLLELHIMKWTHCHLVDEHWHVFLHQEHLQEKCNRTAAKCLYIISNHMCRNALRTKPSFLQSRTFLLEHTILLVG